MNIAFFGDTHGQVYHLLAAVITWQKRSGTALDMVIQVGDFGAEFLEKMTQNIDVFLRYPANNPAQFDFLRVLYARNQLANHLGEIRSKLRECSTIFEMKGRKSTRMFGTGGRSQPESAREAGCCTHLL